MQRSPTVHHPIRSFAWSFWGQRYSFFGVMDRPSLILVHKKRNALYSYTQSLSNAAAAG